MHETAIQELDRAALQLLQTLKAFGGELTPYLEADHLTRLQAEVVALRRALLGAQMGPLYWETPPDIVASVLAGEPLPIGAAAERAAALLTEQRSLPE